MNQFWSYFLAHTSFVMTLVTWSVGMFTFSMLPKPRSSSIFCSHMLKLMLLIPVGLYSAYIACSLFISPARILSVWGWGGHGYIPFVAMTWSAMALLGVISYKSVYAVVQVVAMFAIFLFFGLALSHFSQIGFSVIDVLQDLVLPLSLLGLVCYNSTVSIAKEI